MTFAVDFDGTLHDWDNVPEGHRMGPPTPGAKAFMDGLRKEGDTIVIFTVRGNQPYVHQWLRYFQIPYDVVTNIKPPADFYIDDHAIRFDGNWAKVWAETHSLRNEKH